jgi:hypothetical protein
VAVLAAVGAANQTPALAEDRLATAEEPVLAARERAQTELLELGSAPREALLEQDVATLEAEAGAVERGLRVEAVVDERGDELEVGLSLDEAAHDPERAEQAAVAEEHPWDERVVRPPTRLNLARDGEARAAVLEDDAGPRSDDAAPEALEEAPSTAQR